MKLSDKNYCIVCIQKKKKKTDHTISWYILKIVDDYYVLHDLDTI